MKKRNRAIFLAAVVVVVFIGLLVFSPQHHYGVSGGTYTAGDRDNAQAPKITFDLNSNRFTFTYDLLSSSENTGTIEIKNGKVIATTDNQQDTYIFEIVDNDTLRFVQKGSSEVETRSGAAPVVDGTEFLFSDEQ